MVVYHGSIDKQSPSFYLPVSERGLHSLLTGHQLNKKNRGEPLGLTIGTAVLMSQICGGN